MDLVEHLDVGGRLDETDSLTVGWGVSVELIGLVI